MCIHARRKSRSDVAAGASGCQVLGHIATSILVIGRLIEGAVRRLGFGVRSIGVVQSSSVHIHSTEAAP